LVSFRPNTFPLSRTPHHLTVIRGCALDQGTKGRITVPVMGSFTVGAAPGSPGGAGSTHGPSRPPACIKMLELCAASLWTDALLQHASIAPPKTASSSRVLRTVRARTERSESTRDLRIVALSSRTDDESAQRCDPSQAPGTAASAMLIAVFGKSASLSKLEKGTRRTASAPAWASMGSAHCPLRHCASG